MAPGWPHFRKMGSCPVCRGEHDTQPTSPRMPYQTDFHLLEQLAKPNACVNGGRVSLWVYQDKNMVKAVVLGGHAEGTTCASVTSVLIEAIKDLGDEYDWMLCAGAGYLRLPNKPAAYAADSLQKWNNAMTTLIRAVSEIASETGLVEIFNFGWKQLGSFRQEFQRRSLASSPDLVLPRPHGPVGVADYFPIVPYSSADGKPLVIRLEGWDFDCPDFQLVADQHLRNVQRELLRDALRRRRTYRGWLKTWTTDWVRRLAALPRREAQAIHLEIPPGISEERLAAPTHARTADFLRLHAARFLDSGQTWPLMLAERFERQPYGLHSEEDLNRPVRPDKVVEVDFLRGETHTRKSTEADPARSWRERCTQDEPRLISVCLGFIRSMDRLIVPYEDLRRTGSGGHVRAAQDARAAVVAEISRRIVIESMVRGWPSFYLTDERDQRVFDRWSEAYRIHVWSAIREQCRSMGVDPTVLTEENVVFDVRFDDDLGCTLRPLMLIDGGAHAQVHGSRAGASASVAIWTRLQSTPLPPEVMGRGSDNLERATSLVQSARDALSGPNPDRKAAAVFLRLALACHPPVAGAAILQEWRRRLGRSTQREFETARRLLEAFEHSGRQSPEKAVPLLREYLAGEPNPVPDAFVLLAMHEISKDAKPHRRDLESYNELIQRRNNLLRDLEASFEPDLLARLRSGVLPANQPLSWNQTKLIREMVDLANQIAGLERTLKAREAELKDARSKRMELIARALEDPELFRDTHPALAEAARKAPREMEQTLETDGLFQRWSTEMFNRYADTAKVVEVVGLIRILDGLSRLDSALGRTSKSIPVGGEARIIEGLRRHGIEVRLNGARDPFEIDWLPQSPWLPEAIRDDVRFITAELGKRALDRMLCNRLRFVIADCISACFLRVQDLMSDPTLTGAPMKESLLTRVHITHFLERRYGRALDMILNAKVPLALAIPETVTVLARDVPVLGTERLAFEPASATVFAERDGQRQALLKVGQPAPETTRHLTEIFADPETIGRTNPRFESLAEGVLAIEVEPGLHWRAWRDAMELVRRELLTVLSSFGHPVTALPEHASADGASLSELSRLNALDPRLDPVVDWNWRRKGLWSRLLRPPVTAPR